MKQYDDSTRKLIKNAAALLVSAAVLISATVAWFVVIARANVRNIPARIQSVVSNEFYSKPTNTLFTAVTTTNSVSSFTGVDSLDVQVASSGWAQNSDWSIDPLIPGVVRQYEMVVKSSSIPSVYISNIAPAYTDNTLNTAANKETLFKSVYVQAAAFVENNGTYVQVGTSVCDNLYNLTNSGANNYVDEVFSSYALPSFTVVINIGVPGQDSVALHNALRTLGAAASITFGRVSTSSGS